MAGTQSMSASGCAMSPTSIGFLHVNKVTNYIHAFNQKTFTKPCIIH